MKRLIKIYGWLVLVTVMACAPVSVVHTDAAPGFRLSSYKTFGFYEADSTGATHSMDYTQKISYLKTALIEQLESRWLRYTETDPDLIVDLGIVVVEEVQTRETDFMTDRPRYMGQRRYSWRSEEVEVRRYKEGTMSVHLVDRARDEMVWQGVAEAVVPDDQSKLRNRIDKAVEELVEKIPQ